MVTARPPAGDGAPAVAPRPRAAIPSMRWWTRWPRAGLLLLAGGFAVLIVGGAFALRAPPASTAGVSAGDAFFTAVSAATLTGLTPVSTPDHWTLLGEGLIAALALLAGLLYLVGATVLLWLIGGRLGMHDARMKRVFRGAPSASEVWSVARTVLAVALGVQVAGAVLLFLTLLAAGEPAARALWWGPFHAVSAFTNAGFSLAPGGYAAFAGDFPVLLVTGALALLGAIGPLPLAFYVSRTSSSRESASRESFRRTFFSRESFRRLPLDSRLILLAMAAVLVAGAAVLLASEWSNAATLGAEPSWRRPFLALFESSVRTAGFSALDTASLREESKVLGTGLMLIGGGAGSVSGGLKVGTIAVLATGLLGALARRERLSFLGSDLPAHAFRHALAITVLFGAGVAILGVGLIAAARAAPLDALFEGISAITLSGWSVGLTPEAGVAERVLLIAAMLAGRFAPLLLVLLMAREGRPSVFRVREDNIRFG